MNNNAIRVPTRIGGQEDQCLNGEEESKNSGALAFFSTRKTNVTMLKHLSKNVESILNPLNHKVTIKSHYICSTTNMNMVMITSPCSNDHTNNGNVDVS